MKPGNALRSACAPRPLPADLPTLTILRGMAAMAVVLFHFADRAAATPWLHNPFVTRGTLGVDLFFVLSGFILAHVYAPQWYDGRFAFAAFLQNRLARIYPLHVVITLAALLWTLVLLRLGALSPEIAASQLTADRDAATALWPTLLAHLLLLHGWGTTSGLALNTVSWSVSAEWFAYLMFPLMASALLPKTHLFWRLGACLLALGLAEAISQAWLQRPLTDLTYLFGILRIAPEFALGLVTANMVRQDVLSRVGTGRWLTALSLMLVALIGLDGPLILAPILFAGLIALLAERERAAQPRPSGRLAATARTALIELGTISYALYLVHPLVGKLTFQVLARLGGFDPQSVPLWSVAVAILASVGVAWIATYAVEHPARHGIRQWQWPRRRVQASGARSAVGN